MSTLGAHIAIYQPRSTFEEVPLPEGNSLVKLKAVIASLTFPGGDDDHYILFDFRPDSFDFHGPKVRGVKDTT